MATAKPGRVIVVEDEPLLRHRQFAGSCWVIVASVGSVAYGMARTHGPTSPAARCPSETRP